ncbi:hypothetical protein NX059_009769 [Plenodomus lindquistii]|nr:hypothetical protein NX059_009769 [Plenodomus lindquistii]
MLALSLRSSTHPFFGNKTERRALVDKMTQLSWQCLANAYCAFDIDDAYFQGLCLLVQVDLGDGNCERARAQVALGLRIAQGRDMLGTNALFGLSHDEQTRRLEIVWSLFMLDRMLLGGNTRIPSSPSRAFELPIIQCGPSHPDGPLISSNGDTPLHSLATGIPSPEQSAVRLQIQIIEIWESVVAEIAQPPSSTDVPIWRHDSPRAAILTRLLDFEMRCETAGHTLSSTGSPTRVLEEPQLAGYFIVWLRFQLMLCVMNCCINHPFIIHIKTSPLKDQVPLTFLQKSYEASLIHANWVTRMLSDMDEAGLMIHDPFIGHLVAIAASIHLEHTMSQYATVADSATQKFNKCLDFVRRLSREWPDMRVTASLLQQLRRRIRHRSNMNYVEAEYDGEAPPRRDRQVHLEEEDLRLLWKLFDYVSTSSAKSMAIPLLEEEGDAPEKQSSMLYPDSTGVDFLLHGNSDPFPGTSGQATYSNLENITVDSIFSFGAFDISYCD